MTLSLRDIKAFLLDMDGTIYLGNRPIPGSDEFIRTLRQKGKKYLFLTNNSSQNSRYYRAKLGKMGIEAEEGEILTSGEVALNYLKEKGVDRIYPLATPALEEIFEEGGLDLTSEAPQMVVVGFDTTLTYKKLARACHFIQRGVPWMTTHPDRVCPTEEGYIPDCGAFRALIEEATGIPPHIVLGKPSLYLARYALEKIGAGAEETLMVGDRLYTDIAMGKEAGLRTMLVFSGETREGTMENSDLSPDFVFSSVREAIGEL